MNKDEARRVLKSHTLRATAPRLAVLQALARAPGPVSHTDVVGVLGTADWDPATVYRNLVKLTEVKLASVVSRAGGQARYVLADGVGGDACAAHAGEPSHVHSHAHAHPHFECEKCGQVSCLPFLDVPTFEANPRWADAVAGASVHLRGACPSCRAG